jgi:hypothetical protein
MRRREIECSACPYSAVTRVQMMAVLSVRQGYPGRPVSSIESSRTVTAPALVSVHSLNALGVAIPPVQRRWDE